MPVHRSKDHPIMLDSHMKSSMQEAQDLVQLLVEYGYIGIGEGFFGGCSNDR